MEVPELIEMSKSDLLGNLSESPNEFQRVSRVPFFMLRGFQFFLDIECLSIELIQQVFSVVLALVVFVVACFLAGFPQQIALNFRFAWFWTVSSNFEGLEELWVFEPQRVFAQRVPSPENVVSAMGTEEDGLLANCSDFFNFLRGEAL